MQMFQLDERYRCHQRKSNERCRTPLLRGNPLQRRDRSNVIPGHKVGHIVSDANRGTSIENNRFLLFVKHVNTHSSVVE